MVQGIRRTHLLLDDTGLTYNRGPLIRWEDMKALDISTFARKGWVHLIYEQSGPERSRMSEQRAGGEQRLKLDEYHLARFDEVIDEICVRKHFENPLPVKEPPPPEAPSPKD